MPLLCCRIYRDKQGRPWAVRETYSYPESDTGACIWEPLEVAGPLDPELVERLRMARDTNGLDWQDCPPEVGDWKESVYIWCEPYFPEEELYEARAAL